MRRKDYFYHDRLVNRLEFRGAVELETSLHVGTGKTSATADAGIIRDFQGRPFIPGSSVKGALRSAVEKRVGWLELDGRASCYLEDQDCFKIGDDWRSRDLKARKADIEDADHGLCAVCRLFGSSVIAGKAQIDDLPLLEAFEPLAQSLFELRDGVGIDRDTGTAVDGAKFDYEAVPSMTIFRFYLSAENLDEQDKALLALGLLEMMNGAIPIGGRTTRGLGRCRLLPESVYSFDFLNNEKFNSDTLMEYLRPPDERAAPQPPEQVRSVLEGWIREYQKKTGEV